MRQSALLITLLPTCFGGVLPSFAQQGAIPDAGPPQQETAGSKGIGLPGFGLSISLGGRRMPPALELRDTALPDLVDRQAIFTLRGSQSDAAKVAGAAGLDLIEAWPLETLGIVMATASLRVSDTLPAAELRLRRNAKVLAVQPNQIFQTAARTARVPNRFAAHNLTTAPVSGTTIAIIDTPVATGHEVLRGAQIVETTRDVPRVPGAHGTAVASLIVGQGAVPGSAQGARLLSFAAFTQGADGRATSQTRTLAKAIDGAARSRPAVLVLAWSGRADPLLTALIEASVSHGICVVAAAGNGGQTAPVSFPANLPQVLAVSAVDGKLRPYRYASRGAEIDGVAVGVDQLVAVPSGYRAMSGTSMAAAFVGGMLARTQECASAHAPAAMRVRMTRDARDLGAKGPDPVSGAGLLMLEPQK